MHYIGSALVIIVFIFSLLSHQLWYLWVLPVIGYSFAWLGHALFEHNKPATFQYPWFSLMADWVMFFNFLRGKHQDS